MCDELHYRFSTKYFDNSTGLIVYRYRNYNPETGKWQTRDPIGEEGGENLYCFIQNNPVIFVDLFGLADPSRAGGDVQDNPDKYFNKGTQLHLYYSFTDDDKNKKFHRWVNMPFSTKFVKTNQQIIDDIKSYFKVKKYDKDCYCIGYISIDGHSGVPGYLSFEHGTSLDIKAIEKSKINTSKIKDPKAKVRAKIEKARAKSDIAHVMPLLNTMRKYLCTYATVDFAQCNAGEGAKGAALKKYLEDFFGKTRRVKLYSTNVTWVGHELFPVPFTETLK